MRLIVTPETRALGINVCMAIIRGARISNKSLPLEALKEQLVDRMQSIDLTDSKILQGYRELYNRIGMTATPPAEHLINLIKTNKRLPNINTVVDCYNLVSAETFLSIGAHDTAHIKGDVVFKIATGREKYTPLGEHKQIRVASGEYACTDDEKILCRMDIKQCDETKITKQTSQFIFYVQGNKYTDVAYLQQALRKACDLIESICDGKCEIIAAE